MNLRVQIVWTAELKPDWASKLIMRFQRKPYSHVGIVVDGKIHHAVDKGVCIEELEEFLNGREPHKIVLQKSVQLSWTREQFDTFMQLEDVKEYSIAQLVWIGVGIKFLKNGAQKRICSEFVGALLHTASEFKLEGSEDFWTPAYLETVLNPEPPGSINHVIAS